MNKTLRIGIACFLGATLGATLALYFNHYFWWAGVLLGGFTGYISYEFKTVIYALADSWNWARSEFGGIKFPTMRTISNNLAEVIGSSAALIIVGMALMSIGATWVIPIFTAIGYPDEHKVGATLLFSFLIGIISMGVGCAVAGRLKKFEAGSEIPSFKFLLLTTNSLTVFMWLVPILLIKFGRAIPDRIASRFVKRVFLLIHSDIRIICMTDATIGALVGYQFNNPLTGGVTGALLGIINYWVVSIRWLKIVPVPTVSD